MKPETVRVGPHVYRIRWKRLLADNNVGLTNHTDLTIDVNKRQAVSQQRDTLLHEVLHAVFDVSGLAYDLGSEMEETVIRRMTPVLLTVLRNEREVIEWLTI